MKKGILLINLGTPHQPDTHHVRQYLGEFLMDPFVIDIPYLLRLILVKGIILRTRPKQSAHAYQKIWTDEGSPLLIHSKKLTQKLRESLDENYVVALGMRYANPSIESVITPLLECDSIHIIPLFPQYSTATTQSAIEKAQKELKKKNYNGRLIITQDFYHHPAFINGLAQTIIENKQEDAHLLFSYHGLPVKQINKTARCKNVCNRQDACPNVSADNHNCYRAQCYATTEGVAKTLGIDISNYSVSFQSRLGKLPWIQPYTTEMLDVLAKKGIKKLDVVCPSFFVDCLETLEEIGIQAKEQWIESGGTDLRLIPCLNDHPLAVKTLTHLIQDKQIST
jgi:protoporphyrin/coproporphyrin ferrochelatase